MFVGEGSLGFGLGALETLGLSAREECSPLKVWVQEAVGRKAGERQDSRVASEGQWSSLGHRW